MGIEVGRSPAFAAMSFLLIVIPGPSVLFVIGWAPAQGRRAALTAVAGNTLGSCLHGAQAGGCRVPLIFPADHVRGVWWRFAVQESVLLPVMPPPTVSRSAMAGAHPLAGPGLAP